MPTIQKLLITSVGTRGDVQPYVALGRGLQAAGYEVTIATAALFADFVKEHGLGFAALNMDPQAALDRDIAAIGKNPFELLRWLRDQYVRDGEQLLNDLLPYVEDTDAVLYAALAFMTAHIAEALGKPSLAAYLQPVTPTHAFSSPALIPPHWLPFKGAAHWWGFRLSNRIAFRMTRDTINRLRTQRLGVAPIDNASARKIDLAPQPILYGYSPTLLPKPADWDAHKHVTGFWQLPAPADYQPPAALAAFLADGDAPVYVGLGSMRDSDAERMTAMVVEALTRTGQRGVLLSGWAGLTNYPLPDTILPLDGAPHDWLFPRMKAIVHHGGAGTTSAALRAGKPNVIIPFFGDQPWWAQIVERHGASPPAVPRKDLTADRLASAVETATNSARIATNAAALGEAIRAEDGVAEATRLVQHYLQEDRHVW